MHGQLPPIVVEALGKALQQDSPTKLTGSKATPSLLGASKSRAADAAKAICLNRDFGLFNIVDASAHATVEIAPAGISAFVQQMSLPELRAFRDRVAERYRSSFDVASLAKAKGELLTLRDAESAIQSQRKEIVTGHRQIVDGMQAEVKVAEQRLAEARATAEWFKDLELPKERDEKTPPPDKVTEGDLDFMRDVSEELVYAWQDAEGTEARDSLERVMLNAGLEAIGEPGQQLPFDGRLHVSDDPVEAGQNVLVSRPGWRLHSPRGAYLIARASVSLLQTAPHSGAIANDRD
jgi:hypothetical protein